MDLNALEKLKQQLQQRFGGAPVSQPNPYAPQPHQESHNLANNISNGIYNLTGKRSLNDEEELNKIKQAAMKRLLGQ